MRAVVCPELGPLDRLVVEEREPPVPGKGQLVIEVRAAGVNFVDGLLCEGRYQIKPTAPYVPGSEVAGVVVEVGPGVSEFAPGDRVIAVTGFGGFAERVIASTPSVFPIPEGLGFERAATLVQSYGTALFALTLRTAVAVGEWVLVLGAGGGIGLAAVDVATALGARVIAAASDPSRLEAAVSAGAQAVIDYEQEDLKTRARELSEGGVDLVVDPVGGRHSEPALRATRLFGRFCVIGFASGTIPTVPLNQVLLNNRTVVGVEWGGWAYQDPAGSRALIATLMSMLAEDRLHPIEPSTFPLEQAAEVMGGLLGRSISGKAVLVP